MKTRRLKQIGGGSAGDGQWGTQATANVVRGETAILIGIESVENSITAKPLLTRDATVTIKIIQQEDLVHRMAESGATFQCCQTMGQLGRSEEAHV